MTEDRKQVCELCREWLTEDEVYQDAVVCEACAKDIDKSGYSERRKVE